MGKIGRNAPCPCGSGQKYKRCCGNPQKPPPISSIRLKSFPPQIDAAIRKHKAQELIRAQQQGLGKPIISAKMDGHQIVAVGNTIQYSKQWKFFPDFLSDYIKQTLGSDWGNAEIAKPMENRHQILQWYDFYCRYQQGHEKQDDGAHSAAATGVVYCYLGLAYNLYLLKHNVKLQERFIARLKNPEQFQGAYYELIVANLLIRTGFELVLEDETDDSSKHCEFSAVSKPTGKKYWVEAKMRSVSGILGKTDADGGSPTSKPTAQLTKHLRQALEKPAGDERLIFIDVNAEPMKASKVTSDEPEIPRWIKAAGKQLDDRERDLKEGEQAYVIVTNMAFHRALDDEVPGHAALAYGLGIPDFSKPGHYRLSEIWRQKQKHIDMHRIMEALKLYPKIPNSFDGSLPLTKASESNRIEIGQTYFFDDVGNGGLLGEVTTATVSASAKTVYFAVAAEDGTSQILSRDISDDELAAYKAHPDAYFGVIQPAAKETKTPFEFFEWLVDCYIKTPKERLLELSKKFPDAQALARLDHLDLVLTLCERWTAASSTRNKSLDSS